MKMYDTQTVSIDKIFNLNFDLDYNDLKFKPAGDLAKIQLKERGWTQLVDHYIHKPTKRRFRVIRYSKYGWFVEDTFIKQRRRDEEEKKESTPVYVSKQVVEEEPAENVVNIFETGNEDY